MGYNNYTIYFRCGTTIFQAGHTTLDFGNVISVEKLNTFDFHSKKLLKYKNVGVAELADAQDFGDDTSVEKLNKR